MRDFLGNTGTHSPALWLSLSSVSQEFCTSALSLVVVVSQDAFKIFILMYSVLLLILEITVLR